MRQSSCHCDAANRLCVSLNPLAHAADGLVQFAEPELEPRLDGAERSARDGGDLALAEALEERELEGFFLEWRQGVDVAR